MKNWFKKLLIPSGYKTTVVAYNSWIVRWHSVTDDLYSSYASKKEESEIFPSEEDAYKFTQCLKDARALLKDRNFSVKVECNQSKMASLKL